MADQTPVDFGRMLREAREVRGVSLRDLSNTTKISVNVLEELERNDIAHLPGGIFGRGFVRSYATGVGLDPEAVIQAFIARFPQDSVTAGHPMSIQHHDNDALESDRRTARTFLRLGALSIPLVAVVLYFGAGHRMSPSSVLARTAAPVLPPATSPPATAPPPASLPAPAVDAPSGASPLSVSLVAARACRVSAVVDGVAVLDELLAPGDRRVLDVHRDLLLTTDDGTAVTMTLNGVDARPLGPQGKAITVRLDPTNFKDYLPPR
jgi:hypothetical protein